MAKEKYGVRYRPLIDLLDQESANFENIRKAFRQASRNKADISSTKLRDRFYEVVENSELSSAELSRLSKVFGHCARSLVDRHKPDIAEGYRTISDYLHHRSASKKNDNERDED